MTIFSISFPFEEDTCNPGLDVAIPFNHIKVLLGLEAASECLNEAF